MYYMVPVVDIIDDLVFCFVKLYLWSRLDGEMNESHVNQL